jgi:hypothetical protein
MAKCFVCKYNYAVLNKQCEQCGHINYLDRNIFQELMESNLGKVKKESEEWGTKKEPVERYWRYNPKKSTPISPTGDGSERPWYPNCGA